MSARELYETAAAAGGSAPPRFGIPLSLTYAMGYAGDVAARVPADWYRGVSACAEVGVEVWAVVASVHELRTIRGVSPANTHARGGASDRQGLAIAAHRQGACVPAR